MLLKTKTTVFKMISGHDVLFIVSFLSISIGLHGIPIIFIFATFLLLFQTNIKVSKAVIILLTSILVSGGCISLIKLTLFSTNPTYIPDILLRNRFYLIRIFYAASVFIYIQRINAQKILSIILILSMANMIVGFFQLGLALKSDSLSRISFISKEPSAAAMFYVFSVPILLLYIQKYKKNQFWIVSYMVSGLLIQSKAQFIIIIGWIAIWLVRENKLKYLKFLLLILGFAFIPTIISKVDQLEKLVHILNIFYSQGIQGLTPENQIWTSPTFRISSFLAATNVLLEAPWGLGFGYFHPYYIDFMQTSEVGKYVVGSEISNVLSGKGYSTPKAAIMELIASCGIFFLIPFIKLVMTFLKRNSNFLVTLSFMSVIAIGFMVELAPLLTYIVILHSLNTKTTKTIY